MEYFEFVKPTFLENWPTGLRSLSIAQAGRKLSVKEAQALGENIVELGPTFYTRTPEEEAAEEAARNWCYKKMCGQGAGPRPKMPDFKDYDVADISAIRADVDELVSHFPNGAFVRLGSRSPKDSWTGMRNGFRTMPEDNSLDLLLDCSERVCDDLHMAIAHNYEPWIFARQWLEIEKWQEFRCFMKGRKLVGISQYLYLDGEFREVLDNRDQIEWAIKEFFTAFEEQSHLDDVVFDVIVNTRKVAKNAFTWSVKLLEINPFFEMTDPCLFDWQSGFDGTFRYNKS